MVDRRIRRQATLRVLDGREGWRLLGETVGRREGTKKVLGGRNGRTKRDCFPLFAPFLHASLDIAFSRYLQFTNQSVSCVQFCTLISVLAEVVINLSHGISLSSAFPFI